MGAPLRLYGKLEWRHALLDLMYQRDAKSCGVRPLP